VELRLEVRLHSQSPDGICCVAPAGSAEGRKGRSWPVRGQLEQSTRSSAVVGEQLRLGLGLLQPLTQLVAELLALVDTQLLSAVRDQGIAVLMHGLPGQV
jgi:hypothetical protein